MKNLMILAAAICMMVAFSSCKKDYTCSCTVAGTTILVEYEGVKKGDAEDACSAAEATYKLGDPEATCTL